MQSSFEQQLVLTCEDCGEKLVVFGTEENWRSRYAVFVCGDGHKFTSTAEPTKKCSPPPRSSPYA